MIKKIAFLTICIMLFTVVSWANTKEIFHKSNPDFKKTFESKITSLYNEYNLQGDFIIGIVNKDGLVYSHAINRDLLDGKTSSLNNDSLLYIASHTKALTGTLLKILEEEGEVDLDKTLYDYLPELIFDKKIDTKTITVRQLLNHTHGLKMKSVTFLFKTAHLGYNGGNKELVHVLNSNTIAAPPGKFRYSNTGPIIAGIIVEKVTGNSWKEEMKKRIFVPLKMTNTGSNVSNYNLANILPAIETTRENTVFRSGFYKTDNTIHASGGTISNINDLSKWLKFNINNTILFLDIKMPGQRTKNGHIPFIGKV